MSLFVTGSIETPTLEDNAPAPKAAVPERTAGSGCLHAIDVRLTPSGGDFGFVPGAQPPRHDSARG